MSDFGFSSFSDRAIAAEAERDRLREALKEAGLEHDRLREALKPILTAHQERTERLHMMVLEAREAIRLNLKPNSPAWMREAFDKLHAIYHGMGGDPFDMHIHAALTKKMGQ